MSAGAAVAVIIGTTVGVRVIIAVVGDHYPALREITA
jgi:hypothetical protein